MSTEKFTATKKYTASDIKKAIRQAKLSPEEKKKIPTVETAMTLGEFLSPLNTKTSMVILDLLLGIGTALKDGGKIKRKPARKSKIAKVMKSSRKRKNK